MLVSVDTVQSVTLELAAMSRQSIDTSETVVAFAPLARGSDPGRGDALDSAGPVSYTHLDVYKRQVVGLLNVVGTNPFEYVAEQAQLAVSVRRRGLRARSLEHDAWLGRHQRQGRACRGTEENQGCLLYTSRCV